MNVLKKAFKFMLSGIGVILIPLSPFFLIFIFMIFVQHYIPSVSSNKINNTLITFGKYKIDLRDYTNYFLLFLQIVVTSVFSYILWKTSDRSNKLSEKIDKREDAKEAGVIRENALIVYYDLSLGIKDLLKVYESRIIRKASPNPKRLFFSDEWIKNVAYLKDKLNHTEINQLYQLYGDLHIIKELLEEPSDNFDAIDEQTRNLFNKVISNNILDNVLSIKLNFENVESILNNHYEFLFSKLYRLTFLERQIRVEEIGDKKNEVYLNGKLLYEGEMKNNLFSGYGKQYSSTENIRYCGFFKDGVFISGTRTEKYDNGTEFYSTIYDDNGSRISGSIYDIEGKIVAKGDYTKDKMNEGYFTIYDKNDKLIYQGEIKDGKYNGKGIAYVNSTSKVGIWISGMFIEGVEHNVKVADSEGFDFYEDQAEIDAYIQSHENDEGISEESAIEMFDLKWIEYASIEYRKGEFCRIIEGTRDRKILF